MSDPYGQAGHRRLGPYGQFPSSPEETPPSRLHTKGFQTEMSAGEPGDSSRTATTRAYNDKMKDQHSPLPPLPSQDRQGHPAPYGSTKQIPSVRDPNHWDNNGYVYPSPNPSRPITAASLASASSFYSNEPSQPAPQALPPLPQTDLDAFRQRMPLGPPSSWRRAPNADNPQSLEPAMLIAEQTRGRDQSRKKQDPSAALVSSKKPFIPVKNNPFSKRSEPLVGAFAIDSSDDSLPRPSNHRHPDYLNNDSPPPLLRQASLGRRSKPLLTTVGPDKHPTPSSTYQRTPSEDTYDESRGKSYFSPVRPDKDPVNGHFLPFGSNKNPLNGHGPPSGSKEELSSGHASSFVPNKDLLNAHASPFDFNKDLSNDHVPPFDPNKALSNGHASPFGSNKDLPSGHAPPFGSDSRLAHHTPSKPPRNSFDSDESDLVSAYKDSNYHSENSDSHLKAAAAHGAYDTRQSPLPGSRIHGAFPAGPGNMRTLESQASSLSERVGSKRPPMLNVEAVRRAEQRGSLTSLNDLIKRATRLAGNLDRGRTASRLGFDWRGNDDRQKHGNLKAPAPVKKKKSGESMFDMLSSFPPPAIGTTLSTAPGRSGNGNGNGWPHRDRNDELDKDFQPQARLYNMHPDEKDGQHDIHVAKKKTKKRRVWGMPLWLLILLMCLLFVIIAASIIIPVVLVVIPKQRASSGDASRNGSLCSQQLPCKNGGSSVAGFDKTCRCLCVNGFTGLDCSAPGGSNCTGIAVDATNTNATAGDALPRLFSVAQTDYSIPLDRARILSLLSAANLSCSSTNNLVNIVGSTGFSSTAHLKRASTVFPLLSPLPQPQESSPSAALSLLVRRFMDPFQYYSDEEPYQDDEEPTKTTNLRRAFTGSGIGAAATSQGIVFAAGAPPGVSAGPKSASSTFTTPAAGTPGGVGVAGGGPAPAAGAAHPSPTASVNASPQELDFARLAVLAVLQYTEMLKAAITAQTGFENFFSGSPGAINATTATGTTNSSTVNSNSTANNITLGTGYSANIKTFTLTTPNGTTIGGNKTSH